MKRSSIRRLLAATGALVTLAIATTSASITPTLAAWNDNEFVSSTFGTVSCAADSDQFSSRASGKLLGGQLLSTNLDNLASVRGVTTTNTGTAVSADPVTADSLGNDAFQNPLSVSVINAINVDLGNLLVIPVGAQAGVVNAYARAVDNGFSLGASGAVNNTGAIQLAATPPGSDPPKLATVELGSILSSLTGQGIGGGIAGLADASLDVGAVASSSQISACLTEWTNTVYPHLVRQYLIAGLGLDLDTPLVGTMVQGVQTSVNGVEASVEALAGNAGVLSSVTTGVSGLVGGLLQTLRVGNVRIQNLNATLNLSTVNALLDDTISDNAGLVKINLATGVVRVDLDALLGSVYGTDGVNGLPPNTQLLVNAPVINALTAATTQALNNWVTDITTTLSTALRAMTISAQVIVDVLPLIGSTPLATITLTIPPTSLSTLLLGNTQATASVALLGGTCSIINPVACTVDAVVGAIVTPLTNGIGLVLGQALNAAIFNSGGIVPQLTTTLTALTAPVITFVSAATAALFGEGSVLSLSANAQNLPNPALPSGTAVPIWASGLPGPNPVTHSTGRYDVAALRLVGVGLLPAISVQLDFARSSSGVNTLR